MDLLPSFMVCCPGSNTHQSTIRPENLEVWSSYTSLRSHLHLFFSVSEAAITQTGLNIYISLR